MTYDGRLLAGLNVLMAVIEAGSMSRAAETLRMTPSGVARSIARLESRLGVRLLNRTTRALRLSDEGRRFWERVGPHVDGIAEAAQDVTGATRRVRGLLRVNVDHFISRLVLASKLAVFLAEYRDLRLEFVMRDQVGDLVADGFDMALRFGEPPTGSFTVRKLLETRIVTAAAPAYIASYGRPEHPRDLGAHECIDYRDPATGRPFVWEFRRQKEVLRIKPPARLMISDVGTMLDACLAGVGIAQVMVLGAEQLLKSGQLVDLFPDWPEEKFPLFAVYPSRRYRTRKVQVFTELCVRLLAHRTS